MVSNYWVTATLSEPKYENEWKFLQTERAFVERKLAERRPWWRRNLSMPSLGVFSRKDWLDYAHKLEHYAEKLDKYARETDGGILPVKFSIFHHAGQADRDIAVEVHVTGGRINQTRKAPERPARLDRHDKPLKFKMTLPQGFSRKRIKVTAHNLTVELSGLDSQDGAVLVNQVYHVHCGPDTEISYKLSSRNVELETGRVEVVEQ